MWTKNVTYGRQHQQLAILNKLMQHITLVANCTYTLELIHFNEILKQYRSIPNEKFFGAILRVYDSDDQ